MHEWGRSVRVQLEGGRAAEMWDSRLEEGVVRLDQVRRAGRRRHVGHGVRW